jgi:hypothetical protein
LHRRREDERDHGSGLGWFFSNSRRPWISDFAGAQGESMREIKAAEYTCGIGAAIVGLGLYSYYVRELLASLLLFSVLFSLLGLIVIGMLFIWSASQELAIWTVPASRNAIAFSRRLIASYART